MAEKTRHTFKLREGAPGFDPQLAGDYVDCELVEEVIDRVTHLFLVRKDGTRHTIWGRLSDRTVVVAKTGQTAKLDESELSAHIALTCSEAVCNPDKAHSPHCTYAGETDAPQRGVIVIPPTQYTYYGDNAFPDKIVYMDVRRQPATVKAFSGQTWRLASANPGEERSITTIYYFDDAGNLKKIIRESGTLSEFVNWGNDGQVRVRTFQRGVPVLNSKGLGGSEPISYEGPTHARQFPGAVHSALVKPAHR
jgi:hypothetical protein